MKKGMDLPITTSDELEALKNLLDETKTELQQTEYLYRQTEERASAIASELYQELVRAKQDADAALEENERLLEGLRAMTEALNVEQIWAGVVTVLKPILGFEHAFALMSINDQHDIAFRFGTDADAAQKVLHPGDPVALGLNRSDVIIIPRETGA